MVMSETDEEFLDRIADYLDDYSGIPKEVRVRLLALARRGAAVQTVGHLDDGKTAILKAAGLHQTSEKILEQAARIRTLERALRIIAEHPVEQSGKWEVGAREMIKVARITLGEPSDE